MTARDPDTLVVEFLGPGAAAGGPLALLGLRPEHVTEPNILRARDERLAVLDRHPLAETPEADEVRLALHAAAATLLHLSVRLSRNAPTPRPPGPTLEQEALRTIAMMGGWNPRALRRLTQTAHARGTSNEDIVRVVRGLGRHPARRTTPARPPRPVPAATHQPETEPIDDIWRIAAAVAVTVVVMLTLAVITVLWLLPSNNPKPAPAPTHAPAPAARTEAYIPPTRDQFETAAALAHELDAARALAPTDPAAALERFESATHQLAERWPTVRADALPDANHPALWCLDAFADADRERTLKHITSLANDPDPPVAAWGAGLLAMRRDPSMFSDGALDRLDALAQSLSPAEDTAWNRWLLAWRALPGVADRDRSGVLVRALDRLARTPTPPSEPVLRALALAADWRPGSIERGWLVGMFDAAEVPSLRLAWITSGLAGSSAAPGVDPTMVLAKNADQNARRALRDRYAAVWRIESPEVQDELGASIARAITQAAGHARDARTTPERVRAIAALAIANTAASLYERDDNEQAASVLDDGALRLAEPPTPPADLAQGEQAGSWGASYLDLGVDAEARIARLRDIAGPLEGFGEADDAVLLREAFEGSPREVRLAAVSAAGMLGARPHAILAAMDLIDSVPKSEANARLIETLTGRRVWTGDWAAFTDNARRALAERLLELVAGDTDEAATDRAAAVIDWAYAAAVAGPSPGDPGPAAHSARALQARWSGFERDPYAMLSDDLSPREVLARRDRHAPLARGPIERFAVEQRALVELMGARTVHERPAAGPRVRTLMDTLHASDRLARDAIAQILEAELVRASLWQIRLGEGPS